MGVEKIVIITVIIKFSKIRIKYRIIVVINFVYLKDRKFKNTENKFRN
jgi:hypothetical protein